MRCIREQRPRICGGAIKGDRGNIVDMKTLTATQARKNLTALLTRAARCEDIGIVCGDRVIALRPVHVFSEDYAMKEYGLTKSELDRAYKKISAEIKRERKTRKLKKFV